MFRKYHALFDYDGVLVEQVDFARVVSETYGVKCGAIRNFFDDCLNDCLTGKRDLIEALEDYLRPIGWKSGADELFRALYVEPVRSNADLVEYIRKDLALKFTCHIATNQDRHRCNVIRDDPIVQEAFESVFCSNSIGHKKPALEYFKSVYSQLGCDQYVVKGSIIFVDDLVENVEAAAAFGFSAHLYTDMNSLKKFVDAHISQPAPLELDHLVGDRIRLVKMKWSHASRYSDILSDPDTHHFVTEGGPVNTTRALVRITANRLATDAGTSIYWSIVNKEGKFVGYLALHNFKGHEISVSFGVHPDCRRRGYAMEALRLLFHWRVLKGRKISFATHKRNKASAALLKKAGLEYRGIVETSFGPRFVFSIHL